jgi:hypothetical protein
MVECATLEDLHAFFESEDYKTAGVDDENKFVFHPFKANVVTGVVPVWEKKA